MEKFISEYRFYIDVAVLLFMMFLLAMFVIHRIALSSKKYEIIMLKGHVEVEKLARLDLRKDLEEDLLKQKTELQSAWEMIKDNGLIMERQNTEFDILHGVIDRKNAELMHLAMIIRDLGKKYAEIDALIRPNVDKRVLNGMK
jgi:ABC-type lipoprotein release transport system permease subunit